MSTDAMAPLIGPGATVVLHYKLTLATGEAVESTFEDQAETLVLGSGDLPVELEERLLGLRVGDRATLEVSAEEGVFGCWEGDKVQDLQRADLGDDFNPEVGSLVSFSLPDGSESPGRIELVDDQKVRVDFNHPLVGHDLVWEVEIIDIPAADSTD